MPTGVPPRQIATITVGLKPLSRISTPSLKESSSSSRAVNTRFFMVVLSGRQVRRLYYPTSPVRRHKELQAVQKKVSAANEHLLDSFCLALRHIYARSIQDHPAGPVRRHNADCII